MVIIAYYGNLSDCVKLAVCGSSDCTSGNTITDISDTTNLGSYNSLVLDENDIPTITTRDNLHGYFVVINCWDQYCNEANVTVANDTDAGQHGAVLLDINNDNKPLVVHRSIDIGTEGSILSLCDDRICANPTNLVFDTTPDGELYSNIHQSQLTNHTLIFYHIDTDSNESFRIAVCES